MILAPENAVQVIRGTSLTLNLTVVDASSNPVNLTGCSIYMTVKSSLSDITNLFQKSTQNGSQITITAPTAGQAQIYLLPSDTQTLDIRDYYFDVWVVLVSGARYAVIPPSTFTVQAGVTFLP
jgi:hypothetical protein